MNPLQDHYIDKHAIANEEFKFECVNCGNLMTAIPGAPGTAQAKCKQCGHTMLYQVDPPKRSNKKKDQAPISVKPIPSKKCPGDYEIKGLLNLNQCYSFLCPSPDCSKVISFIPKESGPRKLRCKWCSTIVRYRAGNSESNGEHAVDNQKKSGSGTETEPISLEPKSSEAYMVWGMLNHHKAPLVNDMTVIGRFDNDNTSDIMIKDKYMSARSLEIKKEISANGGILFKATVLRASNPVLIQQRDYPEKSSIYLNDGDIIRMGMTTLTFKLKKNKDEYSY